MGLKKVYIAPAGTTPGTMPANGSAWSDLGDVLADSCTLKDEDVEETVFESETSSRKITLTGKYKTTAELTLMDPDLDMLAKMFGGTVAGTNGARKWTRPLQPEYKEWAVWLAPLDGLFVGCPAARIIPTFDITYSSKGICQVPLKIKFQDQLIADEGQSAPTTGN